MQSNCQVTVCFYFAWDQKQCHNRTKQGNAEPALALYTIQLSFRLLPILPVIMTGSNTARELSQCADGKK
jgi:hypothetical protein